MRSDAAPPLSAAVQSALTGTNTGILFGTGAFGFSSTAAPVRAGDIVYWNGSTWVTLPGNNSGTQVLSENGSGVPSWSSAGAGSVTTPGAGLVSSVTAACSQSAGGTTLSKAECLNSQNGASYTIDGDRAKVLTGGSASAIGYSLPQAGAASAFQVGWYVDVFNNGVGLGGVITITTTTSAFIYGNATSSTLVLNVGESARIISDGTNYEVLFLSLTRSKFTNSLGADVALNNTANYFDGPSVAQGNGVGSWLATGTVTLQDATAGGANMFCKLWDGTTVIASGSLTVLTTITRDAMSLSGIISQPAGSIRISCRDQTTVNGSILFNQTGNSKDSTVSAVRIQ